MKSIFTLISVSLLLLLINSCNQGDDKQTSGNGQNGLNANQIKGLNINILLDLSNRISTELNPEQIMRDKESIKCILNEFTKKIETRKSDLRKINDKLTVFFNPEPTNPVIAKLTENLCIDFSRFNNLPIEQSIKEKRNLLLKYNDNFNHSLDSLYALASKDNKYFGSNIFDFFKDEVKNKCIKEGYTNVLIIVTDGYMYWKNADRKVGNRFNYIERNEDHIKVFRNNPNWENEFEEKDYGFMKTNQNLEGLEILVLEISPEKEDDFQILKKYWTKWFGEMKAKRYDMFKTGQPVHTKDMILKFFEKVQ